MAHIRREGLQTARLHHSLLRSGDAGDPCKVLFLHGFPECAVSWTPQLEGLSADADCVAPDLRGCGRSARPVGPQAYHRAELVADVQALADALGWEDFALVGHDWGGILSWWVAENMPNRVTRLCTLSAPHPSVLARALIDDPRQRAASAYITALQAPGAAAWLEEDLDGLFARTVGKAGPIAHAHKAEYFRSWQGPDGLAPAVNWYRQNDLRPDDLTATRRLLVGQTYPTCPVLVLHGAEDKAFAAYLFQDSAKLCAGEVVTFADCDHWPGMERPHEVNTLLRDFLID